MPINCKESATPPPMIGKIGPYTVFVTPPATPKPSDSVPKSPEKRPVSPANPPPLQSPLPPVQLPPVQFQKPDADGSAFGFFWTAVAKVQNAHSSLDDYVARWFGLNQSKYQWALDNYYETKGVVDARTKDLSTKAQSV